MKGLETFATIDFETANKNCSSVCSVGVVLVEGNQIVEKIYSLIRPRPNFYSYWNTQIHGLRYENTEYAPEFDEVWGIILDRISGLPLVAHNSPFDEACLRSVFMAYEMFYPDYKFYCTCRLARKTFPGLPNYKLSTVSEYCGFDLTNHHHALSDAEACAHIMIKILEACK